MTVGARRVAGLAAGIIGPDGRLSAGVIDAPAVVIAAGGLGQAFATTSNPAGATGDGIAIAARAGAALGTWSSCSSTRRCCGCRARAGSAR